MKLEFDFNMGEIDEKHTMYGQINIKVHKDQEDRFKLLNLKFKKRLTTAARQFVYKLMDELDSQVS